MRQAAAQIADQRIGEIDQPLGDARPVHDLAGEDEERHRHEGEQVEPLEEPFRRHREEVLAADLDQAEDAGDSEHVADRQADQQKPEEGDGDEDHWITLGS